MLARDASSQTSWRSSTWILPPGPTGSPTTVTDLNGRPCERQYSERLFASSSVWRPRAAPEKETIWNSILPCAICTRLMNLLRMDWSNTLRAFLAQSRESCQSKNTTRLRPMTPRSCWARIKGPKSSLPAWRAYRSTCLTSRRDSCCGRSRLRWSRRWWWWSRWRCWWWSWFWGRGLMGFWHRTIGSWRDYNWRLFSRRFNFIVFLLPPLRLIVCV